MKKTYWRYRDNRGYWEGISPAIRDLMKEVIAAQGPDIEETLRRAMLSGEAVAIPGDMKLPPWRS